MNKQIDKILEKGKAIAIVGHVSPDGDCFGSISAVYDYIIDKFNCITVHCFADVKNLPCEFLPFTIDLPFNPEPFNRYDVCICVDCGDLGRLGIYQNVFNNSSRTICIDHHITNTKYADINIVLDTSSNCEILYYMLKKHKYNFKKSTLGKLCAGILTDTMNLSTNSVGEQTYLAMAEMKKAGVDIDKIRSQFLGNNSLEQYKLLALAMNSAKFYNNNTIMIMELTREQLEQVNATYEDVNPVIGQAFKLKSALCALLLSPRGEQIHGSFRAKPGIDVSILAKHFGGGGHKPAAAFTRDEFRAEDYEFVINNLTKQIADLPQIDEKIF